jgi:hypothetical protein
MVHAVLRADEGVGMCRVGIDIGWAVLEWFEEIGERGVV